MTRKRLFSVTALFLGGISTAGMQMVLPQTASALIPGQAPHYFSHPNYANSQLPVVLANSTVPVAGTGVRKFLDTLPGLNAANNLNQMIPVAIPDTTTYPGSDYYEIGVVQYRKKMHSDLPATLLRGYVQLDTGAIPGGGFALTNANLTGAATPIVGYRGVRPPHYLGPLITATKNRPVRILFRNLLPTGEAGNLFLPTDITVMGSGTGPGLPEMDLAEPDPTKPRCGTTPKPDYCFTENRADLHLHGGLNPWISDGTPHQWITPVGERAYPDGTGTTVNKGVSVQNAPDMWFDANGATITSCAGQTTCNVAGATNNPGNGAQTYYYTNQQSARMLFYHDHAWGITRLNVYAGEAAGLVITDPTEQSLITQGLVPGAADTIPLIIQDKTFVPGVAQLNVSDETWDSARWGGRGNLWLPHVYSPAQNPGDSSGVNQFGRWAYGPWFWPPTQGIDYPPINNPYYCGPTGLRADGVTTCAPACDPNVQWCEPPQMPGTPWNSMGMEAFHDTPVVNGTAYPTVTLQPKAYRLRVLNASSDRFFNLGLYTAVDANNAPCDAAITPTPAAESTGVACTEVALNPAEVLAAQTDPIVFPTPDTTLSTAGPNWIQIGTEGGFLPAPVIIPPQPITWVTDPTVFNAGNVDKHALLLGPAERADVIVDLSAYAGKTLILYNDAPAAFPARDPRLDYYTGHPDMRSTGGAPPTLRGYGPNTRTMMQIKVAAGTGTPFNTPALQAAFTHKADGSGVFESGQHPIIVGQGAYNSAYGTNFVTSGAGDGFVRIFNFNLTFNTLSGTAMTNFPLQPKALHDEMGATWDPQYGRMSGQLGLEVPLTGAGVQQNMILYPYTNPASELINTTNLPKAANPVNLTDPTYKIQPFSVATDGTQLWRVTHNGVDTHPIHFHLFDVQLINRVGWDGIIRPPDANELGWKDTVRISPLEDTIVALRPVVPVVPFQLPNSVRPLNPSLPIGSMMDFNSVDANANPTVPIRNQMTNFGWEYVWHCHILSHEEMDMMRPISAAVQPVKPSGLNATVTGSGASRQVNLTWIDNSLNETGFVIQRATNATFTTGLTTFTAAQGATAYTDTPGTASTVYYRVRAINKVGYNATAGYSNMTVNSLFSNIINR